MTQDQAVSVIVDLWRDDFTKCHRCQQFVPSSWIAGRDSKREFICEDCHLADLAETYFAETPTERRAAA